MTSAPRPRSGRRRTSRRHGHGHGRGRARAALVVLALFSLGGGAWLLAQSSLLDVEEIQVKGARHTSPAEVREAVGVELGEPLLFVNRGAAARRVGRLPWVDDTRVRFSLPSTLVVEVTEREPAAWVTAGRDRVALIDGTGRVLETRRVPPAGLMQIEAARRIRVPNPGRMVPGIESPLAIAVAAPRGVATRVVAVRPARGGWVLELDSVQVVRLGAASELERKWAALEAVVDRLGDRTVYLVDVRVPSVPAVREERSLPTTTVPVTTTTAPAGPPTSASGP